MALRSKEWFYKQCILENEDAGPLADLSWTALLIGVAQRHGTRGHMTQAIGAVQMFLESQPGLVAPIQALPSNSPVELTLPAHAALLAGWIAWFAAQAGDIPTPFALDFGYNYDTLRGILTPTLGGTRLGGGGGDHEFKLTLRLMADFLGRA